LCYFYYQNSKMADLLIVEVGLLCVYI